jgi:hypothetical protein
MIRESLSSEISSRLSGSEEALGDNAGFCAPYLTVYYHLGSSVHLQKGISRERLT